MQEMYAENLLGIIVYVMTWAHEFVGMELWLMMDGNLTETATVPLPMVREPGSCSHWAHQLCTLQACMYPEAFFCFPEMILLQRELEL